LAASAWRREKKAIQWANACIDEPFGALDMANRRAMASHLTSMLGGRYGFVQTFVVAHDRAITDGLPKRIELVGTREGTRFG
jgi:ABC-type sulfate/molybdate transport systems ATPase subunit